MDHRTTDENPASDEPEFRRRPQQERSRQKVEAILDATAVLIGEKGIDSVAMRDIARAIDAPLSVIYQYFPNKSAIVAMLYARFTDEVRATTARMAASITGPDDFIAVSEQLLDGYYDLVHGQPLVADIISAVLADKKLQHLDVEDSRWHAETLARAAERFAKPEKREEFNRAVFLFNHLIGGLMRLMLVVGEAESRVILDDYKKLARQRLQFLLQ